MPTIGSTAHEHDRQPSTERRITLRTSSVTKPAMTSHCCPDSANRANMRREVVVPGLHVARIEEGREPRVNVRGEDGLPEEPPVPRLRPENQGAISSQRHDDAAMPHNRQSRNELPDGTRRLDERRDARGPSAGTRGHELRHEAENEVQADGRGVAAAARGGFGLAAQRRK